MKKFIILIAVFGLCLGIAAQSQAHSPICNCFDEGDGSIICEGGFSNGASASGITMRVLDASGKTIASGTMDENSEFTTQKPQGEYSVVMDAGEGHVITIPSSEIME